MMKAKFQRSYRSKNGNVTFVYGVTGSEEAMEQFQEIQGEFYREDEKTGEALWFTTKYIGEAGTLIATAKGTIVPDMSEIDKLASMVAQQGGNFGEAIANVAAQALLGRKAANTPSEEEASE